MNYKEITKITSIPIKITVVKEAKFTIAIPTYKRTSLLREAIDSCLQQKTNIPFNILIVDNDPQRNCETEELITSYVSKNISYYKNTENLGLTGNWNKLFELAQTDFVVMLHDDDKLEDDYIQKINKVLKHYQEKIDAIYVETRFFSSTSTLKPRKQVTTLQILSLCPNDFQFYNVGCIAGACFNRKSVIKLNGFNEYFDPCFDYELHLRLSQIGKVVKILKYPLSLYRVLENYSMKWSTITSLNIKDREIQLPIIIYHYPGPNKFWSKKCIHLKTNFGYSIFKEISKKYPNLESSFESIDTKTKIKRFIKEIRYKFIYHIF